MSVFGELGDKLNSGLGKVEDVVDDGKKLVGEGVDWGTNQAGGLLDRVGLEGAADAVEDWGDDVASSLGATPGEQQLGQTDQPSELIHGNPGKINKSAGHLKDFHKAFDQVAQGMRRLDSGHWKGEAAETFREKFAMHPVKWGHAATACGQAATALEDYAETVVWALKKAQDAIDLYDKGRKSSGSARKAYNTKVDTYNAKLSAHQDPGPRPEAFHDPGKEQVQRAQHILADARRGRNEAAERARSAVHKALAHAPAEPPPLSRLGGDFTDLFNAGNTELLHFEGGVVKGTAGLLNLARTINPTDPYNLLHPAAYAQNVNMTLAGLVSSAAHPERTLAGAWEGLKKDPSEFLGRLVPELAGTKGAGLARSGLRLALKDGAKEGLEEGAETGLRRGARHGVESEPEAKGRTQDCKDYIEDPVDAATGRMLLGQTDVELPGALPLVFRREFESSYRTGRWFGPTWSSTIDQRLEVDSQGVVFVGEDGLLLAYPHPAPGAPTLPEHGPAWPLDRTDGGYTLTDPETGTVRHFADHDEVLALLEQIDDRTSHFITFSYDADGTPRSITHSGGYRLTFSTANGRITALHLAGAAPGGGDQELVRYGYTDDGHLTDVVKPSCGTPTRFGYDERGRITSWTDTNNSSFSYAYDDEDRCIHQSGEAGHERTTFTYRPVDPDTGLRTTTVTDSFGHRTHFAVNDRCQIVARAEADGTATRYVRDHRNRLLAITDPHGHSTTFDYDEAGHLITMVRPDGREAHVEYGPLGLPEKITSADGTVTRQTYDERGNRTSVTDLAGNTNRFAYDDAGHLASVTDPLGQTTTVRCDATGLPVEVADPLGSVTRWERDAFGRVVAVTDPLGGVTRLTWTVEGHLTSRTDPNGATEAWTYDGEGNCTSHTNPAGGTTRFDHSHFDLLCARTDPDGARYTFTHDTELRLTRVTNPQGLTWDYTYDPLGRPASETDFDGRTLTYTHDATGLLAMRTNALGETMTFERDALGRVTRKDAAGQVTTYSYDFTDQLAQVTDSNGSTVTILRDRHGRVLSETVDGRTLTYAYDALGRRTGRTTPTGATSTWAYDAVGRPARLTAGARTLDFAYDATGREVSRQIGATLRLEQAFDPTGRLIGQVLTTPGTARPLRSRAYHYRSDGYLTGVMDRLTGVPRRFDLDAAGRVTAVQAAGWTERYAYDDAGNQTSASWPDRHPGQEATGERTYEGTRITRAGRIRYEYDALGRTILRQKSRLSRKPDTWHYEWDTEDRLTAVLTPDGTRWRYTYDPLGRRTAKHRLAPDGATVVEQTIFTWDGTTLCEQTTTATDQAQAVTLTWDHRGVIPLAQTERVTRTDPSTRGATPPATAQPVSGLSLLTTDGPTVSAADDHEIASRFFAVVTDLIGTPTELVDDHGTVAWHTRSTLWGTTAWNTTATAYTPLRFPGQYHDPETGLHYNHFRTYDPETARYLSPDPLGLAPASNPVAYVHNPFTWLDYLGLAPTNCKLKDGEQYVYRAVKDEELKQILNTRRFQNHPGIESKYFSSTAEGAALYARSAFARFPHEGPYTLVRGIIRSEHIPLESRIEHLADGGGGIDSFALWEDAMSKVGRVRILPHMPIP
ncbi:putative T7SS-secreted protein [Streptomyces odontomachi]|uniref:putative T7SS-secreted protein n=1 Tax=Streptomyces odontomachi TaxID=2944940 RepID=UPI00210B313F|nr:DUF6531 domain-containing protein [Streptomyces sp. ODS25]